MANSSRTFLTDSAYEHVPPGGLIRTDVFHRAISISESWLVWMISQVICCSPFCRASSINSQPSMHCKAEKVITIIGCGERVRSTKSGILEKCWILEIGTDSTDFLKHENSVCYPFSKSPRELWLSLSFDWWCKSPGAPWFSFTFWIWNDFLILSECLDFVDVRLGFILAP